ncbi:MAG: glucose-6-phosphate dehydrogenase, partial [Chloroflexi bacterium]|nr:glucose-6-phosphate dehydrogenase [Chloroflexota bacterium]
MSESQNPLREGLRMQRTPQPNTVVIFGASGDLTKRKLVPAFYNLELERLLPTGFAVLGVARRDTSAIEFRKQMLDGINSFSR